jgi:hypothetical protein
MTDEVRRLKEVIDLQKSEIDCMKGLVESNPLLASRHAKVKELE